MKKWISILGLLVACKTAESPIPVITDAGTAIVDNSCTLLEGITQNQTIISVCATIEEIATIASYVANFLHKGATADAGTCTSLGKTGVCATKAEIGQGIQLILEKRRIKLLLDAGAQ